MSYDLGVFHSTVPLDAAAASQLYVQLCEGTDDGSVATSLGVSPALEVFYRALVARFPEIDDDEDDSPFTCSIEHTDRWVIMNVSFSRAEEVAAFVEALAKTHGLDCYDPQEKRLMAAHDPLAVPRPPPAPRLPPREGRPRFVAGVDPKLQALGFAMVRPTRIAPAWRRIVGGLIQRVELNLGTRDIRIEVAFGTAAARALVERVRPGERRPLPTKLLEVFHFTGWIPGEPWAPKTNEHEPRDDFNHAICHEECLARSLERFPASVERYALPLFARMSTPGELDALMSGDRSEPFETPRPNWGGQAFWERCWSHEVALLHRLALARTVRDVDGAAHVLASIRTQLEAWKRAGYAWYSPELEAQVEALAALDASEVAAAGKAGAGLDEAPRRGSKGKTRRRK